MTQDNFIIPMAKRVAQLPPYVFSTVFKMRDDAVAAGREVIDLGVGNPDGRAPANIIAAMVNALGDQSWNCHRYGTFNGLPRMREAIAAWYYNRFTVKLDADTQTLPLIGSKEGIANLMRAYLNAGDTVIIPTPCYPAYFGAAGLCEANIKEIELRQEDGFLPRLDEISTEVATKARMLILNYPNNPTGGICDLAFYEKAVQWCRKNKVMLVSDIAYSELGFDADNQPPSVFQVEGAFEVAVEFQSLSKSHNLAGWRVGFVVGAKEVIKNLARVKSNVDFSLFGAVQMAAVEALTGNQSICQENRDLYQRRRNLMVSGLRKLGWDVPLPPATMYIWSRIPTSFGDDDFAFITEVFQKSGVLIAPGSGFGIFGKGYARISLVTGDSGIKRVMELFEAADINWS